MHSKQLQKVIDILESQNIDELSSNTLSSYIQKASRKNLKASDDLIRHNDDNQKKWDKVNRRLDSTENAQKKLDKRNEAEELSELAKATLKNYLIKSSNSANANRDTEKKRFLGIHSALKKIRESDERIIAGGTGKGKPFNGASVEDHKSALKHHENEYRISVKNDNHDTASHHVRKYIEHRNALADKGIVVESDLINSHIQKSLTNENIEAHVTDNHIHVVDRNDVTNVEKILARIGANHNIGYPRTQTNENSLISADKIPDKNGRLYPARRKQIGPKDDDSTDGTLNSTKD